MPFNINSERLSTIEIPCRLIEAILAMEVTALNEQSNANTFSIRNV